MTIYTNDLLRVTANMTLHGSDKIQNVWHIQHTTATDQDDDDFRTHVSKWLDALYTCIVAQLNNGIVFDDIAIYNLTQDRPLPNVGWDTLSAGTGTDNDLPPQVAALITTDTAVKRKTGKKYYSGFMITGMTATAQWTSAILTVLACVALKMFGTQTYFSITSRPGVVSGDPLKFDRFENASIDPVPATQRRRRPGTGI